MNTIQTSMEDALDTKPDIECNFTVVGAVNTEEVYWVASSGESPDKIFFTRNAAFSSKILFLDSFSNIGEKVQSYKLASDDEAEATYTTDF